MSDEFDFAAAAEEEASAATGKFNFGKLKIIPRFLRWEDRQPTEVDAVTYSGLDARHRSLEYVFQVDVQEFKPDLKFVYERRVGVGSLDWNKILKPSIEALMGGGSTDKETLASTLRSLNGRYVCAEDVPQTPTKNNPDRSKYNTIRLAALYDTREACYAAWQEKYGSTGSNGAAPIADVPPGYTADTWARQADDIRKLRVAYIQKGKAPEEATKLAGDDYGATAEQVVKLLGLPEAATIEM